MTKPDGVSTCDLPLGNWGPHFPGLVWSGCVGIRESGPQARPLYPHVSQLSLRGCCGKRGDAARLAVKAFTKNVSAVVRCTYNVADSFATPPSLSPKPRRCYQTWLYKKSQKAAKYGCFIGNQIQVFI